LIFKTILILYILPGVQENAAGLGVVLGKSKAGAGWQLESLGPHAGK